PRLWHAIERNALAGRGLLSEAQTTAAWARGEYAAVLASLARKVDAITKLFERVYRGTFQTNVTISDQPSPCVVIDPPRVAAPATGQATSTQPARLEEQRGPATGRRHRESMADHGPTEAARAIHGSGGEQPQTGQGPASQPGERMDAQARPDWVREH